MKYILIIIIAALAIWGGYALMNKNTDNLQPITDSNPAGGTVLDEKEVKIFSVTGKPFCFTPLEIRVKEGDSVRIVFTSEQGTHDWVIDEFGARTQVLQAGQTETLDFRATKKGTFEYYCAVGNHREMGMKGTLIVE